MDGFRRRRDGPVMAALTGLGVLYIAWLSYRGTLASSDRFDGTIGVLLGLFTCSYPAAHFLDLLLFHRYLGLRSQDRRSTVTWLILNGLVLTAGLVVIIVGMTRFTRRVP
jgi:hypothetical protein